jgi:penicillin-binding protein 1A
VPKKVTRKAPQRRRVPAKRTTRFQRFLLRYGWTLPVGAILIGSGILGLTYAFASIPLPRDLDLDASAEVYDMNDRLIGTFSGEVRRFIMDTSKLPNYVGEAVVAAEDRDFYDHNGVSLRGIIRATWANVTGGEIRQGGSTITQQYVKTAILKDPSRTLSRKVKEAILAIKLERQYSKKQILGFYLNTIYLGRGAYGVKAAARTYFDKRAPNLTLGEAAYLAGIIPSPESYQPDSNPDGARARRDRVLEEMVAEGYITQSKADKASRGKVKVAKQGESFKRQEAAYFIEWLRKDFLYPEYGSNLFTGGLKIYTTLDPEMQEHAESAVASVLDDRDDPEASLVATTPKGEVRAFVGGRAFESVKNARGFNYASDPPGRQAGSAFKPFTLAAAVEEGISAQSRFSGSSPHTITEPACSGPEGLWTPENYGGSSYGTLTVDQATTNSVNVVYAQLAAEVGPENVADVVADFGFDREDAPRGIPKREIAPNCSLALGTLDVTPVEMARAYAAFAARGTLPEIMPIRYITNSDGDCLKKYRPERRVECDEEADFKVKKAVEQNTADVVTQTLTHVVQGGTATVASLPGRPVAGKTGTTQNNVDAWFAGYTPQLVTVVWEGYPAERGGNLVPQMGYCSDTDLCRPVDGYEVTGGGAPVSPAVIWYNFMLEATADMEVVSFPVPIDQPDTVINSAPPPPPAPPKPEKSEEPKEEPSEEPPESPPPSQEPTPTDEPSGLPTPSDKPDRRRREKAP